MNNDKPHTTAGFEYYIVGDENGADYFRASYYMATREEATAMAAKFPKGLNLKIWTCGGPAGDSYGFGVQATLHSNGINKGLNETGLKRIAQLVKACEKLGVSLKRETNMAGMILEVDNLKAWLEAQ